MAADFSLLQRICKLVVLLCLLHISVTVFYYVRSFDNRFSFQKQNQNTTTRSGPAPPRTGSRDGFSPGKQTGKSGQRFTLEPEIPLEKCPETSPLLVGPLRVEFNIPVSLEQIKKDNPNVQLGGHFKPKDCEALQKVAVIIPFRKRDEHLKFWLYYLHPILQRQQLDYGVYIINQFTSPKSPPSLLHVRPF